MLTNQGLAESRFIVHVGPYFNETPAGSALLEETERDNIRELKLVTTIQNEQDQVKPPPSIQSLVIQDSLPGFVHTLNGRTITITESSILELPDTLHWSSQQFSLKSTIDINWQDVNNRIHNMWFCMRSVSKVASFRNHYSFQLVAGGTINGAGHSFTSDAVLNIPFSFLEQSLFFRPPPELLLANPTLMQITPATIIPYLHSDLYAQSIRSAPFSTEVEHVSRPESFREKRVVTDYFSAALGAPAISTIGYMMGAPGTEQAGLFLGWRLCNHERTYCMVYFKSNDMEKPKKKPAMRQVKSVGHISAQHMRQRSRSIPGVTDNQQPSGAGRPRSRSVFSGPQPVHVSLASLFCQLGLHVIFNEEVHRKPFLSDLTDSACDMLTRTVFSQ